MLDFEFKKAEKDLKTKSQEYNLLTLRVEDLKKNYNPNAEKTRKYTEDTELINSSEKRLKILEKEIEELQKRVTDFKKKENMAFTPRDGDRNQPTPNAKGGSDGTQGATQTGDASKDEASGGVFVSTSGNPEFGEKLDERGRDSTFHESRANLNTSPVTTYSQSKPKSTGDAQYYPPGVETPSEKRTRLQREHSDFFLSKMKSGETSERYNPYPSAFEQTFQENAQYNPKNQYSWSKYDDWGPKPSGIKTNPYYTPNRTMTSEINLRSRGQTRPQSIFTQEPTYRMNSESNDRHYEGDGSNTPKTNMYFDQRPGNFSEHHVQNDTGNMHDVSMGQQHEYCPGVNTNIRQQSNVVRQVNFSGPNRSMNEESGKPNPSHGVYQKQAPYNSFERNNDTSMYPQSGENHNQMIRPQTPMQLQQTGDGARQTFIRRLRSIPKFNGESYDDLKDFVDTMSTLYSTCINETEEDELFQHMLLQLRGEAKTLVLEMEDLRWEQIKEKLLSHFSYLSNQNVLISQLENMNQGKDESLDEYATKARKLLRDRDATYKHLSGEQKKEHNRIARRAFTRGIKDQKLRERLITRGSNSLEDAIAFAIEAENDEKTAIPRNEQFCTVCRVNGHRERDCKRKLNEGNLMTTLVSALQGNTINSGGQSMQRFGIRGRNFSGRSPMPNNNYPRFPNNRNNDYRSYNRNNNFNSNQVRDNSTPWSWNQNGGNRPWNANRMNQNNNNDYNNRYNQQPSMNKQQNDNQQGTKPQYQQNKRPPHANFNTINSIPSEQRLVNTSSSEGSEN